MYVYPVSEKPVSELKHTHTHTQRHTPVTLKYFDWLNQIDLRIDKSFFCALSPPSNIVSSMSQPTSV